MQLLRDLHLSRKPAKAFALMGVMWATFAAFMPDIKAQIGANDAQFGTAFMLGNLSSFLTAWVAPRVDRWLGRYALAISGVAMALSLMVMSAAQGLWGFAFGMFLAALTSGACDILMNSRVSEIEALEGRSLMNLNHATFSFAYAGAALVSGFLREAGWSPFSGSVLVLLGAFMLVPGSIISSAGGAATGGVTSSGIRGGRLLVWLIGVLVLVAFLTESTVETWSALHLERTLHGDPAEGALGPTILGLTMGLGRIFGQLLAARMRDMMMLFGACLVAGLGMTLIGIAPTLGAAYAGLAVLGLGVSLVFPLAISLIGRLVPADMRVRAIGQATVIGYGAFFLGPLVVGLSAEMLGLRMAFVLVGAMMASVAVLIVPLIARRSAA